MQTISLAFSDPPSSRTSGFSTRRPSHKVSNISLIDWDKNVLDFVYSCLHPEPRKFALDHASPLPQQPSSFPKSHRRIVSATTNQGLAFVDPSIRRSHLPPTLSRIGRFRGHQRNISDPGRSFYPRLPSILPPVITHSPPLLIEDKNISNHHNLPDDKDEEGGPDICDDEVDVIFPEDTACLLSCLQPCANASLLLIALCAMVFVQSMVSSGYLSSIVTTLERRFDLTSRQVGYLYASFEVTGVLATIAFSFLDAAKWNRPRIIGLAGLLMGLGFALFALPHWLSGAYTPPANMIGRQRPLLCLPTSNVTNLGTRSPLPVSTPTTDDECVSADGVGLRMEIAGRSISTDYTVALPLFCFALALAGLGASPLSVLAPTFFWDNLSERQYPLYSGLFYSAAALGPACGFILGASFLQVYIDSPQPPPSPSLDPYTHAWLGAWWMGMLVFGGLAWLTSLPVLTFPKRLPNTNVGSHKNGEPQHNSSTETTLASTPVSGAPQMIKLGDSPVFHMSIPENVTVEGDVLPANKTTPTLDSDFLTNESQVLHRPSLLAKQSASVYANQNGIIQHATEDVSRRTRKNAKTVWKAINRTAESAKGLFIILSRVMTNPIWLGVTATTVAEQTIISAFLTYAAKYMQAMFRVPAHLASVHTGSVVVPSAVFGVLTGALLMRHFRPTIPKALLAVLFSMVATLTTSLVLMLALSCPTNRMAGVTATYAGARWQTDSLFHGVRPANLSALCNTVCDISTTCLQSTDYNPVCWQQRLDFDETRFLVVPSQSPKQMSFLNPCLAGCSQFNTKRKKDGRVVEVFSNCNCVSDWSLEPQGLHHSTRTGSVSKGVCQPDCSHYTAFLVVMFLHIFLTGINQNPSNVITLSCVSPEDGTVALGLQVFFTRTLAYIPAPIYFGMLLDYVCQVRAKPKNPNSCVAKSANSLKLTSLVDVEGACLEYNIDGLPYMWLGGVVLFKLISLTCVYITWRVAGRSKLYGQPEVQTGSNALQLEVRDSDPSENP